MAELFSTAFANLMTGTNIFLMLVGVVVGTIFGCVPGLSAAMAIALFLPVTFGLPQYSAFALLMALYIGGVSGSLISAILINVPGSPQSIATCYDGHPMAVEGGSTPGLGYRHAIFLYRDHVLPSDSDLCRSCHRRLRGKAGQL